MRTRSLLDLGKVAIPAVLLALTLSACGDSGSSGTSNTTKASNSSTSSANSTKCDGVPGTQLVALEDDKKLQTVDNVIPAINAGKGSDKTLVGVLDKVSDALDTQKLVALNKQTDIERKTPKTVAQQFASQNGLDKAGSGGSGTVKIGAANFSENQTLGYLYADALNGAGYKATVQTIGNRELYLPALEKGEIDVVPEYAGTLTEFLNKAVNGPAKATATPLASPDLNKTVQALTQLGAKVKLAFGKPSAAADQNAFAVTKAFADKNGLTKLSDVSKCNGGKLVLGGPAECPQRPFCQPGLEKTYGIKFAGFKALDAGGPLTKAAIKTGKVQIGLVFSSDAALASQ
jgi:osmoprotectant transport system substrate-binding protein